MFILSEDECSARDYSVVRWFHTEQDAIDWMQANPADDFVDRFLQELLPDGSVDGNALWPQPIAVKRGKATVDDVGRLVQYHFTSSTK